jgi:hypothetical protein
MGERGRVRGLNGNALYAFILTTLFAFPLFVKAFK